MCRTLGEVFHELSVSRASAPGDDFSSLVEMRFRMQSRIFAICAEMPVFLCRALSETYFTWQLCCLSEIAC